MPLSSLRHSLKNSSIEEAEEAEVMEEREKEEELEGILP